MNYIEDGNSAKLYTYKGICPKIHKSVFLCDGVKIIGDVEIGENCSIWFTLCLYREVVSVPKVFSHEKANTKSIRISLSFI